MTDISRSASGMGNLRRVLLWQPFSADGTGKAYCLPARWQRYRLALPNPLIFRCYLTPPLPAYFLFLLIGADHILQ